MEIIKTSILLRFKINRYFLATLALMIVLGGMVSASHFSPSLAHNYSSAIVHVSEQVSHSAIIVTTNQAASFNHFVQTQVCYFFAALLTFFVSTVINYQYYKPTRSPPPWYVVIKFRRRIFISGWKVSNFQFKAQSIFH